MTDTFEFIPEPIHNESEIINDIDDIDSKLAIDPQILEGSKSKKKAFDSKLEIDSQSSRIMIGRFKCSHCEAFFEKKNHLKQHVKTVHHLFECDYCPNSFDSNSVLITHICQSHSSALENYKCEYCAKTFISKSHLEIHVSSVHYWRY